MCTRTSRPVFATAACLFLALTSLAQLRSRPMSIEDRLLLNRLILTKQNRIQVMLMCAPPHFANVLRFVHRLNGESLKDDEKVGYLRVDLPIETFARLILNDEMEA